MYLNEKRDPVNNHISRGNSHMYLGGIEYLKNEINVILKLKYEGCSINTRKSALYFVKNDFKIMKFSDIVDSHIPY